MHRVNRNSVFQLKVGMEGNGFEPTIDALFGENGFFPDTASKAMYWAKEKMPSKVNEFIKNWIDPLKNERMKRQVFHKSCCSQE